MSSSRRSSRLSQLSTPSKDENNMDLDDSEDMDTVNEIIGKKTRKSSTPSKSPSSTPKSRPKTPSKGSHMTGSELYSALKGGAIVHGIVSDWLNDYQNLRTRARAVTALISLVLQMALVDQEVPVKVVEDDDEDAVTTFVKKIKVDLNATLPEFPLQAKTKKGLSAAYSRFWRDLMEDGSESALNDEYLISRLLTWLSALVDCPLRPIRHAATVTSFHLCREVLKQLDDSQNELKKAKAQSASSGARGNKKGSEMTRAMKADIERREVQVKTFEAMANQIWNLVFLKSWKDKDPAVRQLCVGAYGEWCIKMPRLYMNTNRFKYLAWFTMDPDANIRISSVETFVELIEHAPLRPTLEQYCESLIERLAGRTREANEHVVAAGVRLFATFRRLFGPDYVNEEVMKQIKLLISADSPSIRRAVGALALLDIQETERKNPKTSKAVSQLKSQTESQILNLLDFIDSCTTHSALPAFVIDAIWTPSLEFMLFQFDEIAALLTATGTARLSESQQKLLYRILESTLAQLNDKALFKTVGKSFKADHVKTLNLRFTKSFYPVFEELLNNSKADDDALTPLLGVIRYLDLKFLGTRSEGQACTMQLVVALKSIFNATTNDQVMKKVCRAFDHLLADSGFKFHRVVETSWRNMIDDLVGVLRGFVTQFDEAGASQVAKPKKRASDLKSDSFVDGSAPGSAPLVVCLVRIESLCYYFDLSQLDDSLLDLVQKVLETRSDGLLNVVGPRSASSAAMIASRLLVHRMNKWILQDDLNESRLSESQDYDVHSDTMEESDKEESSDMDIPDTPSRNRPKRGAQPAMEVEEARPKKKKSKKVKLFGSVGLVKIPSEQEMSDLYEQIEKTMNLLESLLNRKADDTDILDLAPKSAFLSIAALLSTFSAALDDSPLKPLVYHCEAELESKLAYAFDAELERNDSTTPDYEERLLSVLNSYYAMNLVGAFGRGGNTQIRRCVAQLGSELPSVSRTVRSMLSQLRKIYSTPAHYAQLLVDSIDYEYDLEPVNPDTPAPTEEEKMISIAHLSRKLAMSLPVGNAFTPTAAKLVLDKLIQVVIQTPEKSKLLLWASVPFISKMTPSAARDLLASLTNYVDQTVDGLGAEVELAYNKLKSEIEQRATGKTSRAAAARGDGARGVSDDDESDEEAAAKKRRGVKKVAAKKKTTAKRATSVGKRVAVRGARSLVIQQNLAGDEDSVTADSEMAHTEDEASSVSMDEEEFKTPAKLRASAKSASAKKTARAASAAKRVASASAMDVDEDEATNIEAREVDDESVSGMMADDDESSAMEETEDGAVLASQASIEMPLTDADLVEPTATRSKRPRHSRSSQEMVEENETSLSASPAPVASQRSLRSRNSTPKSSQKFSKYKDDEETSEENDSDSDDMMQHTPVTKRRKLQSR